MKSLEQRAKGQGNALLFWWIFLLVSILCLLSPTQADKLISFEASMALAFTGLVFAIISVVMISIYGKRKKLLESLLEKENILDIWNCPDRYEENHGQPIPAYFSTLGIFYGGEPYSIKSYYCVIEDAAIIDDEGKALSVTYTVPNSRNGAFRHKNLLNIPIPEGKLAGAEKLAAFYSQGKC